MTASAIRPCLLSWLVYARRATGRVTPARRDDESERVTPSPGPAVRDPPASSPLFVHGRRSTPSPARRKDDIRPPTKALQWRAGMKRGFDSRRLHEDSSGSSSRNGAVLSLGADASCRIAPRRPRAPRDRSDQAVEPNRRQAEASPDWRGFTIRLADDLLALGRLAFRPARETTVETEGLPLQAPSLGSLRDLRLELPPRVRDCVQRDRGCGRTRNGRAP